jgi:hypothetical protein
VLAQMAFGSLDVRTPDRAFISASVMGRAQGRMSDFAGFADAALRGFVFGLPGCFAVVARFRIEYC